MTKSFISIVGTFVFFVGVLPSLTTAQESKTSEDANNLREQTIYVPYEKLRRVFEKEGRGVFLPYNEFKTLWDAARDDKEKIVPAGNKVEPPAWIVKETENVVTVSDEVANVESKVSVEIFKTGWHEIPLQLASVAITDAKIGETDAKLLGEPGKGFRLLIEKPTVNDETKKLDVTPLTLTLKYAKKIEKAPGRNSVAFDIPQAPISRWRVVVPQDGAKIDIAPLIAASEEKKDDVRKSETVLLAFVGPTPQVNLAWTPKAEGATDLAALVNVQQYQRVVISEGVVRTRSNVVYAISRASISELSLKVPSDQKVVGVFDPNIKKWSVKNTEDNSGQIIHIELFEAAKNTQAVRIELEKMREQQREPVTVSPDTVSLVTVPVIEVLNVARQQGLLVIATDQGLTTETVKTTGLVRVDRSELPQTRETDAAQFESAYRFTSAAYQLDLAIVKVEPRITSRNIVTVELTAERLAYDIAASFLVEKAGVFRFPLEIPKDAEVRTVTAHLPGNNQPVAIDNYKVAEVTKDAAGKESDTKTLTIHLVGKALGPIQFAVRLEKSLQEPNLQSPTGKTVELPLVVPFVAAGFADHSEGAVVIRATQSFRLNATNATALQSVSMQQIDTVLATPSSVILDASKINRNDRQLGFLCTAGQSAASLTLVAERRKPQITVKQVLTVRVEDGVVKYTAKFSYNILFSGVKTIRVDVPEALSDRIRRTGGFGYSGAGPMVPQPENVEKGFIACEYWRGHELSGNQTLVLSWEEALSNLEVGKQVSLSVARLVPFMPEPGDRAWGQIILAKSQSIDIGESEETPPVGLKPIDPQYDVDAADRANDVAAAFEFHDDWSLPILVTRYKLEEVKRTSFEQGLVRANLTFSKFGTDIQAQALYRIRSVEQRLELMLLGQAMIDEVRIDGRRVVLESDRAADTVTGNAATYMVPLTAVPPDTPFTLEIRYNIPASASNGLVLLPYFASKQTDDGKRVNWAAQVTYLAAYIPQDWVVTGYNTSDSNTWSKHFRFVYQPESVGVHNNPNVDQILAGFNLGGASSFQTSGTPYLFSFQQSVFASGDGGPAIKVVTAGESGIRIVPFIAVLLLGVVLLRFRMTMRFSAAFMGTVMVIVTGFICTTLSELVLCQTGLYWALLLVLVLWSFVGLIRCCWNWRKCVQKTEPSTEPQS